MRGSILAVICLLVPLRVAGVPAGEDNLFFIQKSENRNEVHYDANLDGCRFSDPPVTYYWRDKEEGPDVTSRIMPWEPPAYGFDADRVTDTQVEIRLNALDDRPITAALKPDGEDCEIAVVIEVAGEMARFRHAYTHLTKKRFLWPKVECVDIHGTDRNGQPVVERIAVSKRGCSMPASKPAP